MMPVTRDSFEQLACGPPSLTLQQTCLAGQLAQLANQKSVSLGIYQGRDRRSAVGAPLSFLNGACAIVTSVLMGLVVFAHHRMIPSVLFCCSVERTCRHAEEEGCVIF